MTSFFSLRSLRKFSSDFCREKKTDIKHDVALILNEWRINNMAFKYMLLTNLDGENVGFTPSGMSG